MTQSFRAYRVEPAGDGVAARVATLPLASLPEGDVTVRVSYSSLNYKDALSARGHRGVTKRYPHTPGIDAAGVVTATRDPRFTEGQRVVVTSYDLGMDTPGGFGEFIRVPGDWVVPLPRGLDPRTAMVLGTAGLTAALALSRLEGAGLTPASGPIVVTGASGGVGSLAVALLAGRGYEAIASTGTPAAREQLTALGASRVIGRDELGTATDRPLLSARYAGGIDTVGGHTLENLIKSTARRGAVAACGHVQSPQLRLTVYPFILRGVGLLGVETAELPMAERVALWETLAREHAGWRLEELTTEVGLDELDGAVEAILRGATRGRVVVRVAEED